VRFAGSARPGQHNAEVYGDLLGLSTGEIDLLTEQGVL
jgi:formyl-CoA transferase